MFLLCHDYVNPGNCLCYVHVGGIRASLYASVLLLGLGKYFAFNHSPRHMNLFMVSGEGEGEGQELSTSANIYYVL